MRMLSIITLVLFVAGCTPIDPPAPQPLGPDQHARGLWSWSLAIQPANPTPKPPEPPSPGDVCDNCRGTGKLGDGVVSVTCPVCNGTGKRTTDEPKEDQSTGDEEAEKPSAPTDQPPEKRTTQGASGSGASGGNNTRRRLLPRLFQ